MNSANILSPQQTIIMQSLVDGFTRKEVALLLGLSLATVKKHINKTTKKLGAKTHDHALALAVARGDVRVTLVTVCAGE